MMASMCMISFWLAIFKTGLIFLLCLIIHEIITIWDSAKQKSHQLEKFQTENKFKECPLPSPVFLVLSQTLRASHPEGGEGRGDLYGGGLSKDEAQVLHELGGTFFCILQVAPF